VGTVVDATVDGARSWAAAGAAVKSNSAPAKDGCGTILFVWFPDGIRTGTPRCAKSIGPTDKRLHFFREKRQRCDFWTGKDHVERLRKPGNSEFPALC